MHVQGSQEDGYIAMRLPNNITYVWNVYIYYHVCMLLLYCYIKLIDWLVRGVSLKKGISIQFHYFKENIKLLSALSASITSFDHTVSHMKMTWYINKRVFLLFLALIIVCINFMSSNIPLSCVMFAIVIGNMIIHLSRWWLTVRPHLDA
jgi:hypothetical protein